MELDISIAPDGTMKVDIKGVKGKSCLGVADLFKKLVGPEASRKLTSEYYEPDAHIVRDVRRQP